MPDSTVESRHIIVAGAGLVGATAALALAARGHRVTVIEPYPPKVSQGRLGVDIRNVALNPASRALLEEVGAWCDDSAAAYTDMHVWEQWGSASVQFHAADLGLDALGWLVENSPLQCRLFDALSAHPRIEVVEAALDAVHAGPAITSDGESDLRGCDLLIAADGGRSAVRAALDIAVVQPPQTQVALATVVRTERAHGGVARQRFLDDGPLALLPACDAHVCSIVWSQSPEAGVQRRNCSEAAFCAALTRASEACLGEVLAADERVVFPLQQQHFKSAPDVANVIFVGDAMRVVHPLAGLGVNLGFEDVRAVLDLVERGWPDAAGWRRLQQRRHSRSVAMLRLLDGFNRLYTAARPDVGWLRNVGVRTFDKLPGLKNQVMREAMGMGAFGA